MVLFKVLLELIQWRLMHWAVLNSWQYFVADLVGTGIFQAQGIPEFVLSSCVKLLVEEGADKKSADRNTLLVVVIAQGFTDCIQHLLKSGGTPNIRSDSDLLPIQIAVNAESKKPVKAGLKLDGDKAVGRMHYMAASKLYTEAIELEPNTVTWYYSLCGLELNIEAEKYYGGFLARYAANVQCTQIMLSKEQKSRRVCELIWLKWVSVVFEYSTGIAIVGIHGHIYEGNNFSFVAKEALDSQDDILLQYPWTLPLVHIQNSGLMVINAKDIEASGQSFAEESDIHFEKSYEKVCTLNWDHDETIVRPLEGKLDVKKGGMLGPNEHDGPATQTKGPCTGVQE